MSNDYEKRVESEIVKRLEEMEKADYVYPKRFGRGDYALSAAIALLCLALIIYGGYIM